MGSLSTALNALSTSFARDFILPKMKADSSDAAKMRVLRWSTLMFAIGIIGVGVSTAWYVTWHPETRIIPLVLGILGYTFGSVLGIFLLALFTKRRGSDLGNVIGMAAGMIAVIVMSVKEVQSMLGFDFVIAFPWRIALGTVVTFAMASGWPTPERTRQPK